jgi:hypothetical protein
MTRQPPNKRVELTPLRGPKIVAILKAHFVWSAIPIYRCGAAHAQAVGWRFVDAQACRIRCMNLYYSSHATPKRSVPRISRHHGVVIAMGTLAQQVIARLQQTERADEFHESIGLAADLLAKAANPNYHSDTNDIDMESVSPVEGEQLQRALVAIIQSGHNPATLASAIFALGKSYDPTLKELYTAQLQASLHHLKQYNGLVYQLLIALSNIREDVFERDQYGQSSQSLLNVEKNVRQAQDYLLRHDIAVPW